MNDTPTKIKAAKLGFPEEDLERENLAELVAEIEKMLDDDDECFCDDFDPKDKDCQDCSYAKICEGVLNERTRTASLPEEEDEDDDDDYDDDEEDDDYEDDADEGADSGYFAGKSGITKAVKKRSDASDTNFVKKKSWYDPKHELDQFGFREDSRLSFVANLMFHGKHTREQIVSLCEEKFESVPDNRQTLLNNAQNHLKARGIIVRTDRASGIVRIVDGI